MAFYLSISAVSVRHKGLFICGYSLFLYSIRDFLSVDIRGFCMAKGTFYLSICAFSVRHNGLFICGYSLFLYGIRDFLSVHLRISFVLFVDFRCFCTA